MSAAEDNARPRNDLYFLDTSNKDWLPWAMRGSYFKLLHADETSGRFTLLIKIEKGVIAPSHLHIGAVEAYVLEGSFHYLENPAQQFTAGCYLYEDAGSMHQPASPEGTVMLAIFHGPVEGFDRNGKSKGRIDCTWHLEVWNAPA